MAKSTESINKLVQERHKAFADVLYREDTKALKKYCRKYLVPIPGSKKALLAGVYKAIQECTDFTEAEKTMAMLKCIDLGFSPLMRPVDDK